MKKLFTKTPSKDAPGRRRQPVSQQAPSGSAPVHSFRRNRTLTGSSSASVKSSNELHADLLSPRAHVHHLVKKRRHLLMYLFAALIAAATLYVAASQSIAGTSIRMVGGTSVPSDRQDSYVSAVDEYLSFHVAQRFYPNLDSTQLTSELQAKFSEVRSVKVSLTGTFGQAQTSVGLRQPVARWIINGKTEYVDSSGVVFDYNAFATPRLEIVDDNGRVGDTGNLVASRRFLAFVGQSVGDASNFGLTVTKATIPLLTTRQLNLSLKGVPYYFKLSIDRSAGEQLEDVSRIIRFMQKSKLSAEYVDVRVAGKAFYK